MKKISSLEKDVDQIVQQEEEERQLAKTENYMNKVYYYNKPPLYFNQYERLPRIMVERLSLL